MNVQASNPNHLLPQWRTHSLHYPFHLTDLRLHHYVTHLSATFRAVCRKRAWSFSFRLCSACVMRALERSRHWRQFAICWANLRSFITWNTHRHGAWFIFSRSVWRFEGSLHHIDTHSGLVSSFYGVGICSQTLCFTINCKTQTKVVLWCYWSFMLISCGSK